MCDDMLFYGDVLCVLSKFVVKKTRMVKDLLPKTIQKLLICCLGTDKVRKGKGGGICALGID